MAKQTNLEFSLMLGLKSSDNMPEDLKKQLEEYIGEIGQNTLEPGCYDLVMKYCKENDIPVRDSVKSTSKIRNNELTLDLSDLKESKEKLEKIKDFFENLGKEKSQDNNFEDLSEEDMISTLARGVNSESTDEEKSVLAFEIFKVKVNAVAKRLSESENGLDDIINKKVSLANSMRSGMSEQDNKLLDQINRNTKRMDILYKQCIEKLNKLIVLDTDEYKGLNYEERTNFLKAMKVELQSIEDFLEDELETSRNQLLKVLSTKLKFGPHLEIVLL